MEIPYQKLQLDTLRQLIKEYVLREGTDYAHRDFSIEEKINSVLKQLEEGVAHIVFDQEEESFNITVKSNNEKG
jgi:uncharacterized protein YheU (UPF0270 family)